MSRPVATVHAIALVGLEPRPVRVEAVCTPGLPTTRLIGLPDTSVREAADRVKTGAVRSGASWPKDKLVVNLAPADLPKIGTGFDLAIAMAVLAASGQVPVEALEGVYATGEVGLDGSVRSVPGILPAAAGARDHGARTLYVPEAAGAEAALVEGLRVVPVADLTELTAVLRGVTPARRCLP